MSSLKAYPGSCHCGDVQYQLKLEFPPDTKSTCSEETIRIYKCNCTICQKMGFFHCRPITPANDFILTSPATIEELGEYRFGIKRNTWYFCKKCGCTIMGLSGIWEKVEMDVEHWAGTKQEDDKEEMMQVWKTKATTITTEEDGKNVSKPYHYVSVNAVTLEPGGQIDLRAWHDNGWIFYVENRFEDEETGRRFAEPYEGGMY